CCTTRTPSYDCAISTVESVEAPSTTITSLGGRVCAAILSKASRQKRAALKVGTITLMALECIFISIEGARSIGDAVRIPRAHGGNVAPSGDAAAIERTLHRH